MSNRKLMGRWIEFFSFFFFLVYEISTKEHAREGIKTRSEG